MTSYYLATLNRPAIPNYSATLNDPATLNWGCRDCRIRAIRVRDVLDGERLAVKSREFLGMRLNVPFRTGGSHLCRKRTIVRAHLFKFGWNQKQETKNGKLETDMSITNKRQL